MTHKMQRSFFLYGVHEEIIAMLDELPLVSVGISNLMLTRRLHGFDEALVQFGLSAVVLQISVHSCTYMAFARSFVQSGISGIVLARIKFKLLMLFIRVHSLGHQSHFCT